jgi:hypothetical protein
MSRIGSVIKHEYEKYTIYSGYDDCDRSKDVLNKAI